MFKVNNRNGRTRCKICSKLTMKTPERRYWRLYFGVSIVNFEQIMPTAKVFNMVKVSKYGAFSGPYFPVFGLNTEI